MRKGGGKSKGTEFERQVCKDLSLWVSKGKREDLYWRSAMSGGRATIQYKKGIINETQQGDITSIDPLGALLTKQFVIECKFYEDLKISQSIIKGKGFLIEFWTELLLKCHGVKKEPILIAKQNLYPVLCLVTSVGAIKLKLDLSKSLALVFSDAYIYTLESVLSKRIPKWLIGEIK